jgi:hypothetical protein
VEKSEAKSEIPSAKIFAIDDEILFVGQKKALKSCPTYHMEFKSRSPSVVEHICKVFVEVSSQSNYSFAQSFPLRRRANDVHDSV